MTFTCCQGIVTNLKDVKWCAIEDGTPGKGIGQHIGMFVLDERGYYDVVVALCGEYLFLENKLEKFVGEL